MKEQQRLALTSEYLETVLERIETVLETVAKHDRASFLADPLISSAVEFKLSRLAVELERVSEYFRQSCPAVDWQTSIDFGNRLVDEYYAVTTDRVWDFVHNTIPDLKAQLMGILPQMDDFVGAGLEKLSEKETTISVQPAAYKLDDIKAMLLLRKPKIREKYHIAELGIFGSYVRGEQTAASDLDILIERPAGLSLFQLLELGDQLSDELGVKVDLVTKQGLKPKVKERVLAEVVYV
ncbi:nucleotidyltransferase domain-containing protein [Adonisia turfae]|uniref:DUF86 domain-containing protein n=1 Tax=Adonisia turfae CCMR0081 TaxID=2292702 RepID=A0A6M0RIN5_9CYAN|nr:DUF86 domain-containing protein [Adonisia turfae CCMR0081]